MPFSLGFDVLTWYPGTARYRSDTECLTRVRHRAGTSVAYDDHAISFEVAKKERHKDWQDESANPFANQLHETRGNSTALAGLTHGR